MLTEFRKREFTSLFTIQQCNIYARWLQGKERGKIVHTLAPLQPLMLMLLQTPYHWNKQVSRKYRDGSREFILKRHEFTV